MCRAKIYKIAFGETKYLLEWAKDERCIPCRSTFLKRIKDGWDIVDALTIPPRFRLKTLDQKIEMLGDKLERYESWLIVNPEKTNEQKCKRVDFLLNEERCRKSSKIWAKNNSKMTRAKDRKWKRKNRPKMRIYEALRHKRYKEIEGNVRAKDLIAWKEMYGQSCCYCGSLEDLTLEHIDPIIKNGTHTLENLLWACRSCNASKGKNTFLFWLWKNNIREEATPPLIFI